MDLGWLKPMSETPRNLKTSNKALPWCPKATAPSLEAFWEDYDGLLKFETLQ